MASCEDERPADPDRHCVFRRKGYASTCAGDRGRLLSRQSNLSVNNLILLVSASGFEPETLLITSHFLIDCDQDLAPVDLNGDDGDGEMPNGLGALMARFHQGRSATASSLNWVAWRRSDMPIFSAAGHHDSFGRAHTKV